MAGSSAEMRRPKVATKKKTPAAPVKKVVTTGRPVGKAQTVAKAAPAKAMPAKKVPAVTKTVAIKRPTVEARDSRLPVSRVATPSTTTGGGVDLGAFASEVSGNFNRGVRAVGGEVSRGIASAQQALAGVRSPLGGNYNAGPGTGIYNAMHIPDESNPLKKKR